MKRNWNSFTKRLLEEVRYLVIAGFGLALFFGSSSLLVNSKFWFLGIYIGIFLILLGVTIVLYRAWPPKYRALLELVGKTVRINYIDTIHPDLLKVGVIGRSSAGKTTFCNFIRRRVSENERTQSISVYVTTLEVQPIKFIGLVDGPGNNFASQYKVVENSDLLVIIVDHNTSDESSRVNRVRLREQTEFMQQIRNTIAEKAIRFDNVYLLLNKSDLWENTDESQYATLQRWFRAEIQKWEDFSNIQTVSSFFHSNRDRNTTYPILENMSIL